LDTKKLEPDFPSNLQN